MPNETAGEKLLARRYRLSAPVGHGGMGTVWQAHDEVLGRDVAVKEVILPHGLTAEERAVQYKRTFREARTAARLGHPGVVTVYDVVEEDGRPWIIMELIRASSLDQVIKREGPLPIRRAADIGRQMLAALHAAHEAGVLHRDVKPSNVLVAAGDRAVLTDFGIAVATGDATLTQTGLVMGSPAYIAPERARGKTAGPGSDLWSLGVTLYAMLNGRSPFERPEPMASLVAIISEDPEPLPTAGPLAAVIDGLLHKDPAERMSAPEAGMLLDEIVREESADTQHTRVMTPPPTPPPHEPEEPSGPSLAAQRAQPVPAVDDDDLDGATDAGDLGDPLETRYDAGDPLETRYDGDPLATRYDAGEPSDATPTTVAPQVAEPTGPSSAGAEPAPVDRAVEFGARPPGEGTLPAAASSSSTVGTRPARRRQLQIAVGVVVVLLLLLVSAMAVANSRDDEPKGRTGAPQPGPARSTAESSPSSASPSTTPSDDGVPEGFREHKDETGFTIAIPDDWPAPTRKNPGGVFFYAPDRDTYVQVDQTDDPGPSALRDWENLERADRFRGYERIRLEPTGDQPPVPDTGDGSRSADWEFTWSSGRMHGLNRGFVANGRGYAIFLVAPHSEWDETRRRLEPVFAHFEPAD
ncbi:serine/threonine-protein kinase [Thermomonospora umbrina]|nr:serine/threonine-protein kinase [Thermomonospora umbrina]